MRVAFEKPKRVPPSLNGHLFKVITGLALLGVVGWLCYAYNWHSRRMPHLSSLEDLQQHLQQLALKAPTAAQTEETIALARMIDKQFKDGKDLGEKLAKALSDLALANSTLAQQERMMESKLQQLHELEQHLAEAKEATAKQKEESAAAAAAAKAAAEKAAETAAQEAAAAAAAKAATAAKAAASSAVEAARLQALALAGDTCGVFYHAEFHGDVVTWGADHRATDAAACCAACHSYRKTIARGGTERGRNATTCNIWVFCGDKERCKGMFGECWLKYQNMSGIVPPALPRSATVHADNLWTTGVIYDSDDVVAYSADDRARNQSVLVLHTSVGAVELQLLPELAPTSVREVQRLVSLLTTFSSVTDQLLQPLPSSSTNSTSINDGVTTTTGVSQQPMTSSVHSGNLSTAPGSPGYCSNCRIYRAEKGFLVQGLLEAPGAYVGTPRNPNPPQKMVMERGLVCWAGGGGGPHFFVNMVDNSGFKDDHLCFAKVAEDQMAVFEKILTLPLEEKKNPNDMNILKYHVRFNVSFKSQSQPPPS